MYKKLWVKLFDWTKSVETLKQNLNLSIIMGVYKAN